MPVLLLHGITTDKSTRAARSTVERAVSATFQAVRPSQSFMDLQFGTKHDGTRRRPVQCQDGLFPDHRTQSQLFTSPLPQRQWADVPVAYYPREWEPRRSSDERPNVERHMSGDLGSTKVLPTPRTHHLVRRQRPGPLDENTRTRSHKPSLLHPQMGLYEPQDDGSNDLRYFPRSISQPNTPGFSDSFAQHAEQQPGRTLRTPTYPFTGQCRHQSASGRSDAAFSDEQEFQLFVEATAGLGPISPIVHDASPSSSESRSWQGGNVSTLRDDLGHALVSPLEEDIRAMHSRQGAGRTLYQVPSPAYGQALDAVPYIWSNAQPPSTNWDASPPDEPQSAPLLDWRNVPESGVICDELPDYAASQAEAQASQRVEATRRAAELKRRWQEGNRRVGRFD
jgi:hypothetical protein